MLISQKGNEMRTFFLCDKKGAYVPCVAFDRHASDEDNLQEGADIAIFSCTGREAIGNMCSAIYIYNDAAMAKCSDDKPRIWKTTLVELK